MNIELKVLDIKDKYKYTVVDTKNKEYTLLITFYDVEVKVNDIIFIHRDTFRDMVNYSTSFGKLDSEYGRNLSLLNEEGQEKELLIIKRDKNIYLKRLYG